METAIKDKQHTINKKEHEKTDGKKEVKTEIDELKKDLGTLKDNYKKSLGEIKVNIGTDLFNRYKILSKYFRYMRGFVRTNNADENEKTAHSEFLFKKLKF